MVSSPTQQAGKQGKLSWELPGEGEQREDFHELMMGDSTIYWTSPEFIPDNQHPCRMTTLEMCQSDQYGSCIIRYEKEYI